MFVTRYHCSTHSSTQSSPRSNAPLTATLRKHQALYPREPSHCWVCGRRNRYRTLCAHFHFHNAPLPWGKPSYQSYDHLSSQSTRSPCSTFLKYGASGSAGIRTHPPHHISIDSADFEALAHPQVIHHRLHSTRTHRTLFHLWARPCLASPRSAPTLTTRMTTTPPPFTICCICTPLKGWASTHVPDESLASVHVFHILSVIHLSDAHSWLPVVVHGVVLCVFR